MLAIFALLMALNAAGVPNADVVLAETGVYTLEDVLRVFRAQGFDLLVAEAQLMGAKGDAVAAGAWANPQVSGSLSHAGRPYRASGCPPGQCSTTGFMVNLSDQAGLVDVASGKHHLRARSAQLAADASQHNLDDAHRQLEAAVKAQFLAVALDQAEQDFCAQASASYQKGLALFADRYRAGDISDADLTRIEIEALEAQQREDGARANFEDDRAVLALLMGFRAPMPPFTVAAPYVDIGPAQQLLTLEESELLAIAQRHRPDLLAYGKLKQSAAAALVLARRSRLPDIALNLNYQQFGTGQNAVQPRTYTAGLTMNLPLFYQAQGEVMRAQANARVAELQHDRALALVRADVRRAQASLKYAFSRSQRSKDHLMVRAAKALDLVRLQYTKGAASLLDLLDAQRTFSQVNLDHLASLGEFWGAIIGLEQALAADVRL